MCMCAPDPSSLCNGPDQRKANETLSFQLRPEFGKKQMREQIKILEEEEEVVVQEESLSEADAVRTTPSATAPLTKVYSKTWKKVPERVPLPLTRSPASLSLYFILLASRVGGE